MFRIFLQTAWNTNTQVSQLLMFLSRHDRAQSFYCPETVRNKWKSLKVIKFTIAKNCIALNPDNLGRGWRDADLSKKKKISKKSWESESFFVHFFHFTSCMTWGPNILMGERGGLGSISPTFYEQLLRAQIPKVHKDSQVKQLFCAFGICERKSCS